jgi:predicted glycosyltransferase
MKDLGPRHFKYNSFQELMYLSPNVFNPNKDIYRFLGIDENQRYVLLRFVNWNAHHDLGHQGMSEKNKVEIVRRLSEYVKVFILSEGALPQAIEEFKIKVPAHRMHDVLAFADHLFGESSTMASESACLGTPAIFIDNEGRGYTDELEKDYGLVFNFTESLDDQGKAIDQAVEIVSEVKRQQWFKNRSKLLHDKIDPTKFLIWFIREFPSSIEMISQKSEWGEKFKLL